MPLASAISRKPAFTDGNVVGVYLDGVVVAAGYGYCLAFPFEACGGVHDCVGVGLKKSEENTRFPPTIIRLFCK